MNTPDDSPAWRKLTNAELLALAPYTLRCKGLSDDAVARVQREYFKMLGRGVARFVHHLHRPPDEREARLLAKAVVAYINATVVPILGGRGGATLQ